MLTQRLANLLFAFAALTGLALLPGCATHPDGAHGPSCATIESAVEIKEHPIQRLGILKGVARRPDLTQHEQTYLVNAIFMGGFGSDQAEAVVSLLNNPSCTVETRDYIREKTRKSHRMLGKDERRIIQALDRPPAPASAPAIMQPHRPADRPYRPVPTPAQQPGGKTGG